MLLVLLTSIIFSLFCPGIWNPDAVEQLHQALTGEYANGHPVLMALIMRFVISCTGNVASLLFVQLYLLFTGLFLLIKELCIHLRCRRLPFWYDIQGKERCIPYVIILLLLSPLFLNPYYITAVVKDTWFTICFIWVGALTLRLLHSKKLTFLYLLLISVIWTTGCLLRHNALPLLILFPVLVVAVCRDKRAWKYLFCIILPFITYSGGDYLIQKYAHPKEAESYKIAMVVDIFGICMLRPEAEADIPYCKQFLKAPYRDNYRFGCSGDVHKYLHFDALLYGKETPFCKTTSDLLVSEYIRLIRKYPLALLKVKCLAWWAMISPMTERHDLMSAMVYQHPKALITSRSYFRYYGEKLSPAYAYLIYNDYFGFFKDSLVWVLASLVIILCMIRAKFEWSLITLMSLVPVYTLTFLVASLSTEYRYLWGCTFIVQTVTLCTLYERVRKWKIWNIMKIKMKFVMHYLKQRAILFGQQVKIRHRRIFPKHPPVSLKCI